MRTAGIDIIQFDDPAFTAFHNGVQDYRVAPQARRRRSGSSARSPLVRTSCGPSSPASPCRYRASAPATQDGSPRQRGGPPFVSRPAGDRVPVRPGGTARLRRVDRVGRDSRVAGPTVGQPEFVTPGCRGSSSRSPPRRTASCRRSCTRGDPRGSRRSSPDHPCPGRRGSGPRHRSGSARS